MKYLITFVKDDTARWLGHLDILRTFERAIRRAELPIAFSNGFNPRERLAFASALSVGVTGAAELATIELTEELPPDALVQRLNETLPPGIQLRNAEIIPDAGSRDLLNSFTTAELQILCNCAEELDESSVRAALDSFAARTSIPVERERDGKLKSIDIRPWVRALELESYAPGRATLRASFSLGAEGSARPAEVVAALGLSGLSVRRVHRVRLLAA